MRVNAAHGRQFWRVCKYYTVYKTVSETASVVITEQSSTVIISAAVVHWQIVSLISNFNNVKLARYDTTNGRTAPGV